MNKQSPSEVLLLGELEHLIKHSQTQLLSTINSTIVLLFWQVGHRVNQHILQNKRGDYGKQIVVTLSRQLEEKFGSNFEEKNLRRMLQFANLFSDTEIVVTLSRQLSWSHFLVLFPLKREDARIFYAKNASLEAWSVRELRNKIAKKYLNARKLQVFNSCRNFKFHTIPFSKIPTFWTFWD